MNVCDAAVPLLYVLMGSLIQRTDLAKCHVVLVPAGVILASTAEAVGAAPKSVTRAAVWVDVGAASASQRSHDVVALNAIHGWHDAGQHRGVTSELGGGLSFIEAPLVQRIALQEVRLLAMFTHSKPDRVRAVFERIYLPQRVVWILLSWEQYLIDFEEGLLIVHEQIKEVIAVLRCEL